MYIVEFKGVLVDELRLTVDMKLLVRRRSLKFIAKLDSPLCINYRHRLDLRSSVSGPAAQKDPAWCQF
jgi:hypothetical protein